MADDTVDNEHPSFVIIVNDTVKNEHPRETDAHGHHTTDETDDGANIEDKNSEIDIKGEDNQSANESVSLDQGNVQLLDNHSVKTEEKKDANTELREDDNIRVNAGTLGDEAEGQPTNGSIVGSKKDVDNKDDIGPIDIPKERASIEQTIDNTEENQNLKEMLSSSRKENENLQKEVESLKEENANLKKAGEAIAEKDMKIQVEVTNLKELNTELEKRIKNELVQMKEENHRLRNDMKKEAEKHKKEMDHVYKKENVRQLAGMNKQTERLLQDADQIQKNLKKECKTLQNEIEEKRNQLQWLTRRFNQEKEGYLQLVQVLTADKKDLLLRMEGKDNEIEKSKTIIQKQEDDISKIGGEIYRLKELNSDLQTRLENELVQTHRKLAEEKETQYKKHKKDLDEMRKQMESIIAKKDEEIKKAKTDIQKHKDEISKIIRENVMQNNVANEKEKQLHATERQLDEAYQYQEKLHEKFCSEIKEKDNQFQLLTYKFNQSLQDRDSFHQQVQALTEEKKDLLLRFSKVASAKMKYNNPNIADLSEEKRPTKLAEKFSELYDNEWTDAFEVIEGENEKEKLTFLLELLMRANQLCVDLSNRHTRKVKQSIATLTLLKPNRQEQHRTGECLDKEKLRQGKQEQNLLEEVQIAMIYKKINQKIKLHCRVVKKNTQRVQAKDDSQSQTESGCGSDKKGDMSESQVTNSNDAIKETKPKKRLESDFEKLQTEQKKTILDATKYFETLLSEDVKRAVTEVIVNEKGIDEKENTFVIAYLAKCIDLCWSMLEHKPPVHVDFPDTTSDIPFDTNKYKTYKPYTKSGKHLEYLVWPALYLHEGGPLLLKGVAQGK